MNHTASKPKAAIASHSADGTQDKSMFFLYFRASSETQVQVLISYKQGCRGQEDAPRSSILGSARVVLIECLFEQTRVLHRAAGAPKRRLLRTVLVFQFAGMSATNHSRTSGNVSSSLFSPA